jgi:DNA-binding response OmpR family regulator
MSEISVAPASGAQESRSAPMMGTVARVLVVDADPDALVAISHPLQDDGYFVATAFDLDGALLAARRLGPFELLITALRPEPTEGLELARHLRAVEPALQVLYITNCANELFARAVPQTADEDVIEEPFSEHELLDAVAALLYWHRRPRRPI